MNKGALPRFDRNETGRDFAVGDIHGCFSALSRSLDAIGFDRSVDRLFSVGDLVDRGPESHLVLDWLHKPWFHAICGNHDFMIWRAALGDPYPAVDFRQHGGDWLDALPPAVRQSIGQRLAALPLAIEIDTASGVVGLVHADCPFDDWDEMRRVPWGEGAITDAVADCCLWSTERHVRKYVGQVRNVRAVVHGHMTVSNAQVLGNVHFIDSGGWRPGGHFTFLELSSLRAIRGPACGHR